MDILVLSVMAAAASKKPVMELVYNTQAYAEAGSGSSYKTTWLPFFSTSTSHNITVDWGDGVVTSYSGTFSTAPVTHTYASDGIYTVKVSGTASTFGRDSSSTSGLPSGLGLDGWTNINSLGSLGVTSIAWMAERGFNFLKSVPAQVPTTVTNMQAALSGVGTFNTSRVTYDLSRWNTSNITNMASLFAGLGFTATDPVASGVSGWDVSNVTNMNATFSYNTDFNEDISGWDVSSVTNMSGMFSEASTFNQDLSGWDVSNVTNMRSTFSGASSFDQDLSLWDVSLVTDMGFMFAGGAKPGNISGWDVSSVTKMELMFYNNAAFNANIGSWDTSSVTTMNGMFQNATSFNQDLSGWCVTLIASAPSNFDTGATAWTLPSSRPVWGTCPP